MKRLRLLLLFALFLTLAPVSAFAATAGAERVADPSSASTWRDWGLENSTENVGRIWTDKTVSNGNIVLSGADGDMTIEKDDDSDFLTSLSAISSTSNLTMTSSTPLDIVLVLDASGSMDDPMGGRGSTKRIDALKAAAKAFVDEIAKANEGISDASQQHRVAVVKFAGKGTESIGNDTYWSGRYKYNYSQRMLGLTACTQDGKGTITSRINAIEPAGATRADEGMNQAKQALDENPRSGAKRVVVFFTDGTPTTSSEFSSSVANSAVSTAKALKDGGTTIYTVGIQNGANPSVDPNGWDATNENKFLHALSSNYPAATKYDELGARATGSDFYKTATSANDLKDVFSGISQDIVSAAGHPTDVVEGAENTSGYVTFTDQLGDYMKVDSFKSVVFAKHSFIDPEVSTDVSTSGKVDTYTFHGTAGNVLYPTGDLKDIIIRVERSDNARTGDKVTVSIPASLIPLRHFNVDEDTGTGNVTLTFPIRVFYESSLKEEAIDLLANPDEAMTDYIASHTEDGKVYFLANAYSDGADGDTTSAFTPATGNSYYYITEDTPLYGDAECTQRARGPLSGSATYYYKRSWYNIAGGAATKSSSVVSFPGNVAEGVTGAIATDESEYLILKKGSRRLTYINELRTDKNPNATDTASTIINPHWDGRTINVALGNNGRISLEQPGTLAISKTVAVPTGFNENYYSNLDFTFNISISGAAGKTFKATVKGKDGKAHGDTSWDLTLNADGNATHTLKHGETLYVYGLPRGTTYTVTEEAANGFETSPTVPQEGTIEAGLEAKAEFTNTYSATGTLSGEDALVGEKILAGRDWLASDKFVVVLRGKDDAPMPEASENGECRLEITRPEGTSQGTPVPFNFGDIIYTAPGTYVYQIYEPSGAAEIPGVTNSRALYTVTVMVTDNHDGTLATTASITPVHDDQGGDVETGGESVPAAQFTNVFDAAEETWAPRATKTLSDASDALGLVPSMFEFTLTPIDGAPMPGGATSLTGHNDAHGDVDFEGITFKASDVGKTYRYRIVENVPANPRQGMTYDTTEWIATVMVTSEVENDESIVKVEASYARKDTAETLSSASFENSYTPVPLVMSGAIKGEKRLVGRDLLGTDDFTFAAALVSGPDGGCASTLSFTYARADHRVTFESGELTFTKPGSYVFEIHEKAPAADGAGLVWDRHTSTATVRVVDDNGTLRLEGVTYDNAAAPDDDDKAQTAYAAFTNRYAPTEVSYYPGLTVRKVLNGRTMLIGEFSFTITGKDADAEPGTSPTTAAEANALLSSEDKSFSNTQRRASGIAEDMAKLTDVTFGAANANKTYAFEVAETRPATGGLPGVTYDKKVHEVVVFVVDNLDGTLSVSTKIDGDAVDGDERVVSFENSYEARGSTDPIAGTKTMANGLMLDGDFSFRLAYAADKNDVVATTTNQHRQVNFGTLSYDSAMLATLVSEGKATRTDDAWTIPYVAYEVTDGLADRGVTPSLASFSLNVKVRDNGKGKLECALELPAGGLAFSNNYATGGPVSVSLAGTKVLSVPKGLAGTDIAGEFEFTVTTDEPGAPMPEHTTASNDATGNVNFGSITFRLEDLLRALGEDGGAETGAEAGALAEQREENPTAATTASDAEANADAAPVPDGSNATDDVAATLAPEASAGAPGAASAPAADPTPTAPAAPAESESDSDTASDDAAEAQIETLALHSPDEAQVAVAAWRTSRQTLRTVSDVALSATDAPTRERTHTFHYVVSESGSVAGVTNDATPSRDVYIKVTDDGNGKLTAQRVDANGNAVDGPAFSFTNRYSVVPTTSSVTDQIRVHKTLTGRTLMAGEFTFELVEDGRVVATGTNDADGSVSLGTITYTEPGTHIYTIRERGHGTIANGVTYSNASYQVKTVVSDNHDGTLAVERSLMADADVAEFENTYEAKPTTLALSATKILDGATLEAGQFTFRLTGGGIDLTATNDATGQVTFREMLLSKAGTYTFTISEVNDGQDNVTYDTATHKVTVTVKDDGQGSLVASVSREDLAGCTFRNTYTPPATPTPEPSTPKTPEAPKPTKVVPQTGDTFDVTPIAVAATIGVVLIALAVVLRKRS